MASSTFYRYTNKHTGDILEQDERHSRLAVNDRWEEKRLRRRTEKAETPEPENNDNEGSGEE